MDWIDNIPSAWTGHREFAKWLVKYLSPKLIVDLGVDQGYSSFVFADALQKNNIDGRVVGIDKFDADDTMSYLIRDTSEIIKNYIKQNNITNVDIIKECFHEVSLHWREPIQILHIDGLHTYEAVKEDFYDWKKFVDNNGVILFHDVTAFSDTVGRFFKEINDYGKKLFFTHSAGLGIWTKNNELYHKIIEMFPNVNQY